jgi:hypothetical protein
MINFGERLLGFSLMCSAFEHKLPGCRNLPIIDFRGVTPHGLDRALLIFNIISFFSVFRMTRFQSSRMKDPSFGGFSQSLHPNVRIDSDTLYDITSSSWFQTFAVFWMLYAFFWVIPRRLNFICWRFGTLCLFHLHRQVGVKNDWVWGMLGYLYGKMLGSKIAWADRLRLFSSKTFSRINTPTFLKPSHCPDWELWLKVSW